MQFHPLIQNSSRYFSQTQAGMPLHKHSQAQGIIFQVYTSYLGLLCLNTVTPKSSSEAAYLQKSLKAVLGMKLQ